MITHSHQHDLVLDPGSYSNDLDQTIFNISVCLDSFGFCVSFSLTRIGNMNTIVEYMVSPISQIFKEYYYLSTANKSILTIRHAYRIVQVTFFYLIFHSKGISSHRKRYTMAIWWNSSFTKITSNHSRWFITIESNLSTYGSRWKVVINSSTRATGYSLVSIKDGHPPTIVIQ